MEIDVLDDFFKTGSVQNLSVFVLLEEEDGCITPVVNDTSEQKCVEKEKETSTNPFGSDLDSDEEGDQAPKRSAQKFLGLKCF